MKRLFTLGFSLLFSLNVFASHPTYLSFLSNVFKKLQLNYFVNLGGGMSTSSILGYVFQDYRVDMHETRMSVAITGIHLFFSDDIVDNLKLIVHSDQSEIVFDELYYLKHQSVYFPNYAINASAPVITAIAQNVSWKDFCKKPEVIYSDKIELIYEDEFGEKFISEANSNLKMEFDCRYLDN